MPSPPVAQAVGRLASRDSGRTEADVQADIYLLLVSGELNLAPDDVARLEVQTGDGTRRRLDVEIGLATIEVKKDLRPVGVLRDGEAQLADYVRARAREMGSRYVGILTDGTGWYLYHLVGDIPARVAELVLDAARPDAERLIAWLEAVLSTQAAVTPTPDEIRGRLGVSSPAYRLDHATLTSLLNAAAGVPEVQLKRQLWAKLLRTAFGKAFSDHPDLFVDHTLLVLTADIIAHAVVGFDVSAAGRLTPAALVQGTGFTSSKVHGVVEADFFDWVLHVDGGPQFVKALAHRIARFDWDRVEHDVLKVLYESVISPTERKSLGEYYTPDWLAQRMIASSVTDPLAQRVLDPACGSGTFLFHAIRTYLAAAEAAGTSGGIAAAGVTEHVLGMDVHPVSVTLARVTYLLAIGNERLQALDREAISIPVYLGDSVQWEQRRDLLGGGDDVVAVATRGDDLVEGGGITQAEPLRFPRSVLHDAGDFDRLVDAMADRATRVSGKNSGDQMAPVLRRFGVHDRDWPMLIETFDTMRRLHALGRDHIWGYYVRNLIRPLWLAEPDHRADVIVGNPPWLRYSFMTDTMQAVYKSLATDLGVLSGPLGASGRDLATLFVARAIDLYLKPSGRFSFVMPHGTLTRKPAEDFRSGRWNGVSVAFDESWDLHKAPTGFPMVACAVHGQKTTDAARAMPATVQVWSAKFKATNTTWEQAQSKFTIEPGRVVPLGSGFEPIPSPYKARFRQGAVLAPRALLFVEQSSSSPLGAGAGLIAVQSRRTTLEKEPWKSAPSLHGSVERAFLRPIHLGETLLPFRMRSPLRAVLPVTDDKILTQSEIETHLDLAAWWEAAEQSWAARKSEGDDGSLLDRIDFHSQLSSQLPAARHRVLYSKAGNSLTAARIEAREACIDHKLYWAAASGVDEARYLTAILNSPIVLERIAPFQALGLFGPRDFDKNVFMAPIPPFDNANDDHLQLVQLAADAEELSSQVSLTSTVDFKRMRKLIRDAIVSAGMTAKIDAVVARVVPPIVLSAEGSQARSTRARAIRRRGRR